MVHKNTDIRISVESARQETPGYKSVVFTRPPHFEYEAGDWVDIEFVGATLTGGKTYSLSSSPTEPFLMITFKEGISPFKKALASVEPGQKLRITQYGNDYGFKLHENHSSLLIAGGVGVAPFRSMLKEMADSGGKNNVQLLYLNQTPEFLFFDEFEVWKQALPALTTSYVITKELKKKDRLKIIRAAVTDSKKQIYIAGPEGMVTNTRDFLESVGVDKRAIRIDSFGGY